MSDLKFTSKIDMSIINPYDVKLGNEFIDNLISTALSIIPKVYSILGDELEISKALVPMGKIKQDLGDGANAYDKKYGQGLALSFTWKSFTESNAIRTAMDMYEMITEQGLHVVIDPYTKELRFFRKMKDKKIFLITDKEGKKKVIKS